jgi:hypothetical protein
MEPKNRVKLLSKNSISGQLIADKTDAGNMSVHKKNFGSMIMVRKALETCVTFPGSGRQKQEKREEIKKIFEELEG